MQFKFLFAALSVTCTESVHFTLLTDRRIKESPFFLQELPPATLPSESPR